MTEIRFHNPPRWRESGKFVRSRGKIRPICVALEPEQVLLRLKGTREIVALPWGIAFDRASLLEANRRRAERKAKRKAGRR